MKKILILLVLLFVLPISDSFSADVTDTWYLYCLDRTCGGIRCRTDQQKAQLEQCIYECNMGRCYSHNQGVTGDLEKRIQVLEIKIRGLENSNEELQRYKVGLGNIATDHNLQLIESYRIISELRDEISRLQSRVKALEQKITAEKGKK